MVRVRVRVPVRARDRARARVRARVRVVLTHPRVEARLLSRRVAQQLQAALRLAWSG